VSVTLRAASVGASIDRVYISQGDITPGMDPYDSLAPHSALYDAPSMPLVIAPFQSVTLPAVDYTLDQTKPVLIAVDFSASAVSGVMFMQLRPEETVGCYKAQTPLTPGEEPEARKTDRTGYVATPGNLYLIERIDVG
jgi:hypothetical protein